MTENRPPYFREIKESLDNNGGGEMVCVSEGTEVIDKEKYNVRYELGYLIVSKK